MDFAFRMREAANPQFRAFLRRPFVTQLAASRLPIAKFRYYIIQDNLFLEDMVEARRVMLSRAHSRYRSKLAGLLKSMHRFELLNRRQAVSRKTGITASSMQRSHRSPTTLAYTSFLIRVAATGSLGESLSASLACPWTYAELGQRYSRSAAMRHPIYGPWLAIYQSKAMNQWLEELKSIINAFAAGATPRMRRRMIHHFVTGCKFECMFWDMAFKMETWRY